MDVVQALSALGSVALILGIIVGILQLRSLARQRQEEMVIRSYAPFMDEAFTRAYWRIQAWNFETYEAFQAKATVDEWATLDEVATFFEMIGVLYKRGLAKLDLIDDLMAGSLLVTWRKVAPLIEGYRASANVPDYAQWFEHLARDLDRRLTDLGEAHPSIAPGVRRDLVD